LSFVYFTDRDLGTRFPEILQHAGLTVERHADHFVPKALTSDMDDDALWLWGRPTREQGERLRAHRWLSWQIAAPDQGCGRAGLARAVDCSLEILLRHVGVPLRVARILCAVGGAENYYREPISGMIGIYQVKSGYRMPAFRGRCDLSLAISVFG